VARSTSRKQCSRTIPSADPECDDVIMDEETTQLRRRIEGLTAERDEAIRTALVSSGVSGGIFNERAREIGVEITALRAQLEMATSRRESL
jgi:hypothetical protein